MIAANQKSIFDSFFPIFYRCGKDFRLSGNHFRLHGMNSGPSFIPDGPCKKNEYRSVHQIMFPENRAEEIVWMEWERKRRAGEVINYESGKTGESCLRHLKIVLVLENALRFSARNRTRNRFLIFIMS